MEAEVVVVGAGVAGLRCAALLLEAGREVVVLEAGDRVGGRVRTDRVDGFLVDRGFQLLNPAYPAVRRGVDVAALELQPFTAGVAAAVDGGRVSLGHPLREPRMLPATLRAAAARPRDVGALLRWAAPLWWPARGRLLSRLQGRPDVDRATGLTRAGVDGDLRRIVDRFYDGVLLEDDGDTAEHFALLLAASFVRGVPSLPAGGMQALPEQLARPLGDRVRLGEQVVSVTPTSVDSTGGRWRARRVVVATDAPEAAHLAGVPAPRMKGVSTMWWSLADAPPTRLLHVDARSRPSGPLLNTAVVSNVAPRYAPPGRHLVQASALLTPARRCEEAEMRRHAGDLLDLDPRGWEVVARHDVPDALPQQPVPFSDRRSVWADEVLVCGDHRDTGSLQGALVSGERAAAAALAG